MKTLLKNHFAVLGVGFAFFWGVAASVAAENQIPRGPNFPKTESICDITTDWQEVEQYNGRLGIRNLSREFVARHERAVGNLKWESNWRASYKKPGNIPNNTRWCSGTMISNNLYLTAAHCLEFGAAETNGWVWPVNASGTKLTPQQVVANMEVAFNYQVAPNGAQRVEQRYAVLRAREVRLGGLDYAILTLANNPGTDWGVTRMAPSTLTVGDELTVIQHPAGMTKKIDSGSFSGLSGSLLTYGNIDTVGGSSGSGVLDWQGRLVGVHVQGGCKSPSAVNSATSLEAIASVSPVIAANMREYGQYSNTVASGDFNGDGRDDSVIGLPGSSTAGIPAAGAIRVIYGAPAGLATTSTTIHQDTSGVPGAREAGDFCGASVTVGRFNNDAFDDVAFGCPGEAIGDIDNAGMVIVLYGSAAGLRGTGSMGFHQDTDGIQGAAGKDDLFGASLATGDFDGNGYMDLAVGVPGEAIGKLDAAGMVNVLYSTANGVGEANSQGWEQDSSGIPGASEAGDMFGAALTTGDFNGDGVADLAIGAPGEAIGSEEDAGAVVIIYGTKKRLSSANAQGINQNSAGISAATAEAGDRFGASLAAGDFDNDNAWDLAIGAPGEAIGSIAHAGAAVVVYGKSGSGLNTADSTLLHQDLANVPSVCEAEDRFGSSLAAGKFNSGNFFDLAVGAPGEAIGPLANAGWVGVFYGASRSLDGTGSAEFHQDTLNIDGASEAEDRFGSNIATGDIKNDGRYDLMITVPGEDNGTTAVPHALSVIHGVSGGITTSGDQLIF